MKIAFLFALALFGCSVAAPNTPIGKCSQNEEFKQCGTACEPTCDNQNPMCTRQCINNVCQCATGYVRNASRQCVLQSECSASSSPAPQQCGANETFRECGTACEPSCSSPEPQMCTMQCILNVCQCSTGFVRSSSGCVQRADC